MTKDISNKNRWESTYASTGKPVARPLVKTVGCTACWATKTVSLTKACWPPLSPAKATI
ncbi:sporulation killing factor [Amphibacillus jilinensis]|uniref:sporulation killing factor n=1 Tax=Amphibacillus jilinensis TaxID=1216008 RepID=UPI00035CB729|nr:sporulation killing factor [Amphibacillus jilinensis]